MSCGGCLGVSDFSSSLGVFPNILESEFTGFGRECHSSCGPVDVGVIFFEPG